MDVPEVLIVLGLVGLLGELLYNWRQHHKGAGKAH
jgi:hypothetical protein